MRCSQTGDNTMRIVNKMDAEATACDWFKLIQNQRFNQSDLFLHRIKKQLFLNTKKKNQLSCIRINIIIYILHVFGDL